MGVLLLWTALVNRYAAAGMAPLPYVPLVNPGEAAILCLGAIGRRPWVVADELAVRWVTTLGLSFDHRLIDGELAARFLATVAGLLTDPLTLLSRL